MGEDSRTNGIVITRQVHPKTVTILTCVYPEAGGVELSHVKLHANDGEHDDGKEEQQANLEQGYHGLHDGLEDHLET